MSVRAIYIHNNLSLVKCSLNVLCVYTRIEILCCLFWCTQRIGCLIFSGLSLLSVARDVETIGDETIGKRVQRKAPTARLLFCYQSVTGGGKRWEEEEEEGEGDNAATGLHIYIFSLYIIYICMRRTREFSLFLYCA